MSWGDPLGSPFGLLLGHRSQEQSGKQLQLQAPNHPGLLRYRPHFPSTSAEGCPYGSCPLESGHLLQMPHSAASQQITVPNLTEVPASYSSICLRGGGAG